MVVSLHREKYVIEYSLLFFAPFTLNLGLMILMLFFCEEVIHFKNQVYVHSVASLLGTPS